MHDLRDILRGPPLQLVGVDRTPVPGRRGRARAGIRTRAQCGFSGCLLPGHVAQVFARYRPSIMLIAARIYIFVILVASCDLMLGFTDHFIGHFSW